MYGEIVKFLVVNICTAMCKKKPSTSPHAVYFYVAQVTKK
jgi:hypothetical protein